MDFREYIILYARNGSVGNGQTQILFYDIGGKLLDQKQLPNVPSEIVLGYECIIVDNNFMRDSEILSINYLYIS